MNRPTLIPLPRHLDPRGNLSVIEQLNDVPFEIERCYWIYDVPGGDSREGHGYRRNEEFVLALSGSFEVETICNGEKATFTLNRCYEGLYVPAGTWREFRNFSTNAVALVVASRHYEEDDYVFEPEGDS